ncbi:MAG: hypothetical protein KF842_07870 [Caulobacter sp.]|nr:hypothetical protein [Caulobacter sp.]
MTSPVPITALAGLLLAACQTSGPATACAYEDVARAEIARAYPDYDATRPMTLIDLASPEGRAFLRTTGRRKAPGLVLLYFAQPKGRIGGSPTVEINKARCRVERVYRTQ